MTDQDRAILALERRFANSPDDGRKEHHAFEELGLSRIGYYQRLNALLSSSDALKHDPLTVNRLRRLRDSRRRSRS